MGHAKASPYNCDMAWNALHFVAPETAADAACDALLAAGALSVDVADADAGTEAEQAIFREPTHPSPVRWNANLLSALFEESTEPASLQALAHAVGNELAFVPRHVSVARVDDADWVRMTQSQFAPIEIEPTLWIVPTWCTPPNPDALNLVLDPGLAFGTGSHPTTALCLRWIAQQARSGGLQGKSLLDYGCGSGILAIAAARLGAGETVGSDIDPQAILVSKENAARNSAPQVQWMLPDTVPKGPYPIVVANILANPLTVLAPMLCGYLAPGGSIILAGILTEQVEKVTNAYAPWVKLAVLAERDGWQLLGGTRAPA
jgi:ribosomal protein L11 methyltransferase